jgi:hypothetical protein
MSNEWAHHAARKEVPTEMTNIIDDGHVLVTTGGCALADSAGTYLPAAVPAQLVQDRGNFAPARPEACLKVVVARPRMTLQNNPYMTRGAVFSGASSGPHRPWDPV